MSDTSDPDGDVGTDEDADTGDETGRDAGLVDAEEVTHVAELARIRLKETEIERFADEFGDILEYFETLDEVPEIEREEDLVNVMRADEVESGLSHEEALANAPETEDGYFSGPKV